MMHFLAQRVRRKYPTRTTTKPTRCSRCNVRTELLPMGMSHRCYGCLACVCGDCVYPYRIHEFHNSVVFCGQRCCDAWVGKRKAERLAEETAEDIGTDDSTRSSSSSKDEDDSMRGFVVPDDVTDAAELSDPWDSDEQYEWAQRNLT